MFSPDKRRLMAPRCLYSCKEVVVRGRLVSSATSQVKGCGEMALNCARKGSDSVFQKVFSL